MAPLRKYDKSKNGLRAWPFMSVKFWGEDPTGVWRVQIKYLSKRYVKKAKYLMKCQLKLHGMERFDHKMNFRDRYY